MRSTYTSGEYDWEHGARPNDIRVLELLDLLMYEYIGMYGEPDPNPEGGLERCYGDNGSVVLVSWRKKPVGLAGISFHEINGPAVLHRMFVRYEMRKRGIASGLLEAAEYETRRLGGRELILETGTTQTSAIALYRSHGYQPVDPFGFYADQPTSIFLGKAL